MSITERLEGMRGRVIDLRQSISKRLTDKGSRANRKEAGQELERGRKLYNKRDFAGAEEHFRAAIDADNSYARAHYYLGLALYKQDDAQAAVRSWKRTIQVDPNDPMAQKAERKIAYVQNALKKSIDQLKDRLNG